MLNSTSSNNPTSVRIMDNGRLILEAILLLQHKAAKPQRIPIWVYLIDYTLTALYLGCYGYGVYSIIKYLINLIL